MSSLDEGTQAAISSAIGSAIDQLNGGSGNVAAAQDTLSGMTVSTQSTQTVTVQVPVEDIQKKLNGKGKK